MIFRLTVVYDDRMILPLDIEYIIGASRFSAILRRRISLGEEIRREVVKGGCQDFFHLVDDQDAHFLREMIQDNPSGWLILRLPSCFMPTIQGQLSGLIAQAIYAPGSMLLTPPTGGEAPALLEGQDILPLLRPYDPAGIRDFFLNSRLIEKIRPDQCGFVDLRRQDQFLAFMGGATETRAFNATRTDRWILHKISADRDKMAAEYKYFHIVPEGLKPFLLPTFGFEDDGKQASYAMERLAIPDAALQFIHNAFDEASFDLLVDRFLAFVQARPMRRDGVKAVRAIAEQTILGKMEQRLERFLASEIGKTVNDILRAAGPLGSLEEMATRARSVITKAIKADASDSLAVGHGDPCLSNILFDRRTGVMRLIDPRGATSLDQAWMHPLYDIAKFSHSVLGGYDFINHGLFDCIVDSSLKLNLLLQGDGAPQCYKQLFISKIEAAGIQIQTVRAYELSLFLSMLPLHVDSPQKLLGFALIAADILISLEGLQ
jgi:hypothetical protein